MEEHFRLRVTVARRFHEVKYQSVNEREVTITHNAKTTFTHRCDNAARQHIIRSNEINQTISLILSYSHMPKNQSRLASRKNKI